MQILETERLRLDNWTKKDAQQLYEYASNPAVGPAAGWRPHASVAESRQIIKKVFMAGNVWKIVDKESQRAIGSIGLDTDKRRPHINSRELGYSMDQNFWGRGLMTEAARAVLEFAFGVMGLDIVAITTGPDNWRSQRVIEKLGFHYEGTERYAYRIYDDSIRDLRCYSLLRTEWLESFEWNR
ncbi:MAG: GNAT family N-acetyltransferase [Anaerovoracaceae bacterium]|jgi:ribosomal-protein-alanine N-acetyltransferase